MVEGGAGFTCLEAPHGDPGLHQFAGGARGRGEVARIDPGEPPSGFVDLAHQKKSPCFQIGCIGGVGTVALGLERRSRAYEAGLKEHGVDRTAVLALFSTTRDWNINARVLTDQYSPANLLNH